MGYSSSQNSLSQTITEIIHNSNLYTALLQTVKLLQQTNPSATAVMVKKKNHSSSKATDKGNKHSDS
jgi:hypothetical protein